MKAWWVFIPGEWGELVHAYTRGEAKYKIMSELGLELEDFIYLRVHRMKKLDDKALTFQNLAEADFHYLDEDGQPLKEDEYFNVCKCEICKGSKP